MVETDAEPTPIEDHEGIIEALQSLESGDEITWWDENDTPYNKKVSSISGEHLTMGDPTQGRAYVINSDKGWTTSADPHSAEFPTHGLEIAQVVVWDN